MHTPPGKVGGEDAHSGGDRNLHEGLTYWDLEESRISSRVRQEVMTLVGERNRASMQLGMGGGEAGGVAEFVKAEIDLSGHHLAARDMSFLHGRSSDPYVSILQNGLVVATTEVVPHNLNPVWKTLSVTVRHGLPVKIKCWDKVPAYVLMRVMCAYLGVILSCAHWSDHIVINNIQDSISSDDLIGEAEVSVQELLTAGKTIPLNCDKEVLSAAALCLRPLITTIPEARLTNAALACVRPLVRIDYQTR